MKSIKLSTLLGAAVLAAGVLGGVGWVAAKSSPIVRLENHPLTQTEIKPEPTTSKPGGEKSDRANSGFIRAEQKEPENKDSDELLAILKLDPVILNAFKPDPNDSPVRKLQKELCSQLAIYLAKSEQVRAIGRWNPQDMSDATKIRLSLYKHLLELMEKPTDKLKCFELEVQYLKEIEKSTAERVLVGAELSQNHNLAKAARLEAEIKLLTYKAEMDKAKK